ncbi:PREDICTED: protein Spindly-B-like [Acropora digitifera]|uniref:protein Spindly-B-like n=1 Tax=Acropora digitifera TaxID=70779 RepID=UPI00077A2D0F|nr:PREDICTED: protein Spindly-B-like [Acropora digitifera]
MAELGNEEYFSAEGVLRLKEENEALQNNLELAGELGKSLLENNQELERKLEEVNSEHISSLEKIEELKQDNYSLRCRLETEVRTNSSHAHELEDLKEKLRKEFEGKEKSQQLTTEKKINDLRKEIESFQNDASKHTMVESQLQEKIKKQEEMLRKAHQHNEELQKKGKSRLESVEEYINLASELQEERDVLLMKVADYENNQERIAFDRNVLKERVDQLEEELQEKTQQGHNWFGCLQEARLEAGEIKAELESLKADNARRNFGKHGNSLFGEVEDRRLELEKKYASLQARHEGMVKIHNMTKQHLQRLKNQVATLLQVKSCHADASQIQRLTHALVQKEGEIKILNAKISTLEKEREENNMSDRLMEFHDAFSEFGDKKDYVNFLQLQLEDSKKTVSELNKELQTKTLLQLAETDRLRHTEHQLHASESKVERLNNENIKLRLKIDDLRMKLQSYTEKKEPQAVQQSNSSTRKTKSSSVELSNNNRKAGRLPQTSFKEQGRENFAPAVKAVKKEPGISRLTREETIAVEPIIKTENGDGVQFENLANGNEKLPMSTECGNLSIPSRISILSNMNSIGKEIKIEMAQGERKSKVRFSDSEQQINPDLSETRSTVDIEAFAAEPKDQHKENSLPEPDSYSEKGNTSTVLVKGQKNAPVVINVKKGETKNQCPQQ